MAKIKITVRPNGPFRVEDPKGSLNWSTLHGTPYDLTGKPSSLFAAAEPVSISHSAMAHIRRSDSRPQKPLSAPRKRNNNSGLIATVRLFSARFSFCGSLVHQQILAQGVRAW